MRSVVARMTYIRLSSRNRVLHRLVMFLAYVYIQASTGVIKGESPEASSQLIWERLLFFTSEDRHVEKVRLRVRMYDGNKEIPIEIESDDILVRKQIERFSWWPWVPRNLTPRKDEKDNPSVAELEVTTNKDKFTIFVHADRFGLDAPANKDNQFMSWGIAKVCDDLQFSKTKQHWPDLWIRRLSGEAYIKHEKELFEKEEFEKEESLRLKSKEAADVPKK